MAMDKNAAKVLAELREDHRNMALMLNILERQSNRIYEGEEPDYELLQDIMHYMTVYPDAVHHPKEDRIYAELKAVRPDLSTGFERITMDHRHIAELSVRLRDDIAAINSGKPGKTKGGGLGCTALCEYAARSYAVGRAGPVQACRRNDPPGTQDTG